MESTQITYHESFINVSSYIYAATQKQNRIPKRKKLALHASKAQPLTPIFRAESH